MNNKNERLRVLPSNAARLMAVAAAGRRRVYISGVLVTNAVLGNDRKGQI